MAVRARGTDGARRTRHRRPDARRPASKLRIPRAGRPERSARHRGPASCAGRGAICAIPRRHGCAARAGAAFARARSAVYASGRSDRPRARRTKRRRRDADGLGQDALLQRAHPPGHPGGPVHARAVSFSDQGARAGSARRIASDGGARRRRGRRRHRRLHVRRRHAAGCAARDPRPRACRPEQPGHGPLRDPAAPSAVGEAVREPALRRHRRVARVSRRLRQSPRQHRAPIAPRLPALRIGPDLHLLVGDDRQPARAGGTARRRTVRAGGSKRRSAWREVLRLRQSARRQRATRYPALVSGRNAPRRHRVPQARAAADRLCAEPALDGDSHDLPERGVPEPSGTRTTSFAAIEAAICRSAAARSSAACATAMCAAWCPPTRSSSGSTSDRSMPRSWRDIPARLPAPGSAPAVPAAAAAGRRRCSSRRARRSTSSSSAIPTTFSARRQSTRSSIPTTCTSSSIT